MRGLSTRLFTLGLIASFAITTNTSFAQKKVEEKEVKTEIKKLIKLKAEVKKLIEQNQKLLSKIQEERKKLQEEKEELQRLISETKAERYKKLAQIFEKMDPELAGQKISQMSDPKEAAYIIYNMKSRKAGEVLNYVNPETVDKIVKILTEIKKNGVSDKSSQES